MPSEVVEHLIERRIAVAKEVDEADAIEHRIGLEDPHVELARDRIVHAVVGFARFENHAVHRLGLVDAAPVEVRPAASRRSALATVR